ncbi:hypothetical protein G6F57_019954 [Rhizopus arrhizus]|nr:hypothetical protein G6F30_013936 [Rhizopus arrhizus]KAG0971731.1 hypothetical protein G6F29_013939 [Rhizopus arrhizus]KAG1006624.1 hypothetical protein G6F26_013874 [Rhizopus arrhizus]KAG1058475.1 hypothetical protein G6F41_013938 [Rhizopus arrhizus]KAG1081238.1 hypothetical protein G6F39_013949 [Rhizopus arrhizus]
MSLSKKPSKLLMTRRLLLIHWCYLWYRHRDHHSDYITVEVIAGDKKTKAIIDTTTITDNTEVDTVTTGVVVGAVNEAIITNKDVAKIIKDIVKKTDSVDIDIVVGEQDVDSTNKDKITSDSQVQIIVKKTDVVVGEEETIVKTVEEVTGQGYCLCH